ncbi:MAG: carboxymuconolactone decarboxylase family protein [Candidatus Nanopelagicales bacterium]
MDPDVQTPRSFAELRLWVPAYAVDAARNLAVLSEPGEHLTAQQHWVCVLAAAAVVRSPAASAALAGEARARLPREAVEAALGAASTMAGNAVYFRAKHALHGSYDDLRSGLRSSATLTPVGDRQQVELACVVAAALLGCEACLQDHEAGARAAGLAREAVNDALRIAAVVASVAATLDADRLVTD